jgi:hypothetical protein
LGNEVAVDVRNVAERAVGTESLGVEAGIELRVA